MTLMIIIMDEQLPIVSAPRELIPLEMSRNMTTVALAEANLPIARQLGQENGPSNVFKQTYGKLTHNIENFAMDDYAFDQQYGDFQRAGYCVDYSSNTVLGNYNAYESDELGGRLKQSSSKKSNKRQKIVKQLQDVDVDNLGEENDGPWIHVEKPEVQETSMIAAALPPQDVPIISLSSTAVDIESQAKPLPSQKQSVVGDLPSNIHIVEPDEEEEKWEQINERKVALSLPPRPPKGSVPSQAATVFHGSSMIDYQGRSWNSIPAGTRPSDGHTCYIPKKCIKKYLGHTKGVQVAEFIPETGHLLLSASLDGKCKIWDVFGDRSVKRTHAGHNEAIKSACFDHTGSQFLSSGFDRYIRLWDVETGQATSTFSNRKMSYQVKFHPKNNNIFIAPASDNKIYQWDTRTGGICQLYNYHLQPVNSVAFFDDGRKFMSSSDDRKLLVWEFDIPVPIQYLQEPELFSMPYLSVHPSGGFIAAQSMDNTIPTFACSDSVKPLRKRTFRGHNNSGYACQISFSPDGKYIMSGDGFGKIYFWEWKSMMLNRKFQAHDSGPCIGSSWHPIKNSWVVTCGWDGIMKLWE